MQNEPINTMAIQQFISQVKSADSSNQKEIRVDIKSARRLALTLGEVMTKLNGDLEALIIKQASREDEVIQVQLDGGSSWK